RVMTGQAAAIAAAFDHDSSAYAHRKNDVIASLSTVTAGIAEVKGELAAGADLELVKEFESSVNEFRTGFERIVALVDAGNLHDAQQYADTTNAPVIDRGLDALTKAGDNLRVSLERTADRDGVYGM